MTGQTIRLAPGEYRWTDAPTYRLHPDVYADITDGLRHFESRFSRPTGLAVNLATAQAFADLYTRGAEVDPGEARMHMFGIPLAVEAEVPTGVLRMRNMWATSDVTLREAPAETAAAPKPPASWDPTPRWQRDHETQWRGTHGNPLLRPTGI